MNADKSILREKITRLEKEIEKVERERWRADLESRAWNAGKYKNSSPAAASGILVRSLDEKIRKLIARRDAAERELEALAD